MSVYTTDYQAVYPPPPQPNGAAGLPITLFLSFFDEETGTLTDPDSVQLDITYGQAVGFVPDAAGPFTYQGASTPVPGQVWRISTGSYACIWQIPVSTPGGAYVANWTIGYESDTYLGEENFWVTGGHQPLIPAGDTGFWTGSIAYTPPAGSDSVLSGLTIPLGNADANGIVWLLQKVEGWDGPDVQGAGVIAKSGDHGAWAAPQYYAARAITLTITASAPTQALRDLARALLQQAIPVSDLAVFTYNEPVPKQAQVRRSGKITETYPTLTDVTFTVGLIAPDPRKYGTQTMNVEVNAQPSTLTGVTIPFTVPFTLPGQLPAGAAAITNDGTFETRPVISIMGPITGPAITNVTTGDKVSWPSLALGAGDVLTADFSQAQAFLNGVFRPADLQSTWWKLPPGTSTIQLSGQASSGASMQIQWQNAYI